MVWISSVVTTLSTIDSSFIAFKNVTSKANNNYWTKSGGKNQIFDTLPNENISFQYIFNLFLIDKCLSTVLRNLLIWIVLCQMDSISSNIFIHHVRLSAHALFIFVWTIEDFLFGINICFVLKKNLMSFNTWHSSKSVTSITISLIFYRGEIIFLIPVNLSWYFYSVNENSF